MPRLLTAMGCFAIVLLSSQLSAKDEADPGATYLQGFELFKQAQKELDAKPPLQTKALADMKTALSMIEGLATSHPNWQPEIVAFRVDSIKRMITKLEAAEALKPQQTSATPSAPSSALDKAIQEFARDYLAPRPRMPGANEASDKRDALILMLAEEVQRLRAELSTLKNAK